MSKSLLDLLNKTRGDIASKRGNNIDLTRLKDGNNYLRIFPNKDDPNGVFFQTFGMHYVKHQNEEGKDVTTAYICIVADSLASMVPNSKAEKFDKMAEGTAKDKDQLNMNDNTALARATSANFPTLALWARKYNACIIFLNQVRTKIGVMFGDPTTSPGGDSPKFYASVRIRLGASVMKDGKEKIGQDVGAECIKNKVAPPFGKCSWKFYFDPTRGLDVVESLVEYMLEEGYLPKSASGRVEIGEKKYTKSQIVEMYREKPLAEIIAALQAIDDRREKTSPTDELEY